jgi:hypothetical protein
MGKYHRKRKIDTTELEKEVVPYDYLTSLAELRRQFDEVMFRFENHVLLSERESRPVATLKAIYRNIARHVSRLNNV